jgi:hypothetical protein
MTEGSNAGRSRPVGEALEYPEDDMHQLPEDTSLSTVQGILADEGYAGQFIAVEEARVLCTQCRSLLAASWLRADDVTRLEGASDPADMMVVIPLTCPVCHLRGTLVLSFGPEMSLEEDEVFKAMPRQPQEGSGGQSTPGMS